MARVVSSGGYVEVDAGGVASGVVDGSGGNVSLNSGGLLNIILPSVADL